LNSAVPPRKSITTKKRTEINFENIEKFKDHVVDALSPRKLVGGGVKEAFEQNDTIRKLTSKPSFLTHKKSENDSLNILKDNAGSEIFSSLPQASIPNIFFLFSQATSIVATSF
jgi:hypothetical protein